MGASHIGIEEFTGEVDNAIDKLFSPERMKHSQGQESDKKPLNSQGQESDKKLLNFKEVARESNDRSDAQSNGHESVSLFERLEEAILTLEWEVTLANINRVQELLEIFRNEFQPNRELKMLVDTMEQVLTSMADSPEKAPVSGPGSLMQALRLINDVSTQNAQLSPETVQNILKQLQVSLPRQNDPPETNASPKALPAEKIPDWKTEFDALPVDDSLALEISGGLHSALKYHVSVLNQLINLIKPVEKLFQKTAGYEKFYAILNTTRQKLGKQQSFYASALTNDYRCSSSESALPMPKGLHYALQSHVPVLDQCAKRVTPAEKAFGKASGMEKFYALHRRIREQLEKQSAFLARVASNQYRSSRNAKQDAGPARTPCPYKSLITAQWGGNTVAFVPEHIVYEGSAAWWARNRVPKQARFPLRYLKSWPWSKLQPQLGGRLAEQREKQVAKLVVPVLNHPGQYRTVNRSDEVSEILLLQYNNSQAAVFLESVPKKLTVSEQWSWEPSSEKDSIVAGHLTVVGKVIPVATLEKI
jgi:hypothetical protein